MIHIKKTIVLRSSAFPLGSGIHDLKGWIYPGQRIARTEATLYPPKSSHIYARHYGAGYSCLRRQEQAHIRDKRARFNWKALFFSTHKHTPLSRNAPASNMRSTSASAVSIDGIKCYFCPGKINSKLFRLSGCLPRSIIHKHVIVSKKKIKKETKPTGTHFVSPFPKPVSRQR